METQTIGLNNVQIWDTGTLPTTMTTTNGMYQTTGCYMPTNTVQWTPNYWYYITEPSPARPIKLSQAEFERLRKAAKADEKLKDVLKKFTTLIEVTVTFD